MARPMPPPPETGPPETAPPAPAAPAADPHPPSARPSRRSAKLRKNHVDATSIARDDLNETRAGCRLCSTKQRHPFRRIRGRERD